MTIHEAFREILEDKNKRSTLRFFTDSMSLKILNILIKFE